MPRLTSNARARDLSLGQDHERVREMTLEAAAREDPVGTLEERERACQRAG